RSARGRGRHERSRRRVLRRFPRRVAAGRGARPGSALGGAAGRRGARDTAVASAALTRTARPPDGGGAPRWLTPVWVPWRLSSARLHGGVGTPMTQLPPVYRTLRERFDASRASRRTRASLVIFAVATSFALTAPFALAPPAPPSEAAVLAAYASDNAQEVDVSTVETVAHLEATGALARDDYDASQGLESLIASGTNHDWAKMVCLFAGFPMSEANVTVITRWMRQENYTDSWWNRNNPLNNGWGASYGP